MEVLPVLLNVAEEVWPVGLGDSRDHRREVLPNCLKLSPHIPFRTESIVQSQFDGIVRVI